MTRLAALFLVAVVAACAGPAPPPSVGPPPDVELQPPEPLSFWKLYGQAANRRTIQMNQGPGHCGWEASTFLHLPNPLGQPLTQANDRLYIRDPEHEFADRTMGPFEPSVATPPDAAFTGYSWGAMELWFSPSSNGDHVLLVREGIWERWPLSRERFGCA